MLLVLSTSAVLAQEKTYNVRGSLDGHGIGGVQAGILQAAASGTGTASQIRRFNYLLQATVTPVAFGTGTSTGAFLLVFSNGDVIFGLFTGQGGPSGTPGVSHIVEQLTITRGHRTIPRCDRQPHA